MLRPWTSRNKKSSNTVTTNIAVHPPVTYQAMVSTTTSTTSEDARMIHDVYIMAIGHLKQASLVSPPAGVTPYFNPEIKEEIPDGINSRGKCCMRFVLMICDFLCIFYNYFFIYL